MLIPMLGRVVHRPVRARSWRAVTAPRAGLSSSACRRSYDDTIPNLMVRSGTKVMVQGFTGRQSTFDCQQSLDFGTNIVGGVRPGKEGEHLGRPYFPTVRAAKEALKPDATLVYVAAGQAAGAIEDAIKEEVPLIVAVAEHIPLHDLYRIQSMLRSQSRSRFVGANSPGMTSMHAKTRLGFQPLPFFKPGNVSIVAKSGTLSYEAIASTTEAGLGQSYAIGIGGDDLPGTTFVDALKIFEQDEYTKGIVLIGEVGGNAELKAAEWIQDYHRRVTNPKPILALLGGIQEVSSKVMGHDGARRSDFEDLSAGAKLKRLQEAGAQIVRHPSYFGPAMKEALASRNNGSSSFQRRSMHTTARRRPHGRRVPPSSQQQRSYIPSPAATQSLLEPLVDVPITTSRLRPAFEIIIEPRREFFKPIVYIKSHQEPDTASGLYEGSLLISLSESTSTTNSQLSTLLEGFVTPTPEAKQRLHSAASALIKLYKDHEGKRFVATLGRLPEASKDGELVLSAVLDFDDWAYQMAKRHEDIHQLPRDEGAYSKAEVEAAVDGIVYLPRPEPRARIGTIVNGAGLAMNTVDNLQAWRLPACNFLDTGGKATSATVAASFRAVLSDARVRVILVNIFGGLTKCEMIAEGILLAFKEVGVRVPVVVRLRGTNEEEGQRVLREGAREMGVGPIEDGAAAEGGGGRGMIAVSGFDEAMLELARALGVDANPPGLPGGES